MDKMGTQRNRMDGNGTEQKGTEKRSANEMAFPHSSQK